MKEYEKYLIETLRNNADHFMTTDYEWSNALVHLLLDSADAIEQKKERAEMIGLDGEICDLPYTLRSIVVSKPSMGSFSKETILKAADAIEELFGIVLTLEAANDMFNLHWISVEDALPDVVSEVLCYCPFYDCSYTASFDGERWWHFGGLGTDPIRFKVTHWMPLPDAPKEVE